MSISLDLGRILFNANQDAKAWKFIEISLINASYVGHRNQVARALEYTMGYGYLCRGDYRNAYGGAYEVAAAEKYFGTVDAWSVKRCKRNMDEIERKQRDPDGVVGFHRRPLDRDETLFYEPFQAIAIASELPISHSFSFLLPAITRIFTYLDI